MVRFRARGAQSARVPIGTPLGIERYGRKLRSTGDLDVVHSVPSQKPLEWAPVASSRRDPWPRSASEPGVSASNSRGVREVDAAKMGRMTGPLVVSSLFLLVSLSAPSWSQAVDRAQLEPSASILLREVAAELCGKSGRPPGIDLAQLSPTSRSRLNDAEAVFRSLGYAQASINGIDKQPQGPQAGPECRAHVMSALWQHFTALGRSTTTSGTESTGAGAGAGEMVHLPGVVEPPQLPAATEMQREAPRPSRPRREASQRKPSLSVAPLVGAEVSTPADAAPSPAAAEIARSTEQPHGAQGATGSATTFALVMPAAADARLLLATRHLGWVGVGLVLVVASLGGWWFRRQKKVTSAELARRRLRPT